MDLHDKKTRSYNMSCIKGKDNRLEEMVRKYLFSKGYRYRKNVKKLPGTPDIVLKKYKTVIFINGCFWHKHSHCKYFVWPKTNTSFWKKKILGNVERDCRNYQLLNDMNWTIVILWECKLKNKNKESTLKELDILLRSNMND